MSQPFPAFDERLAVGQQDVELTKEQDEQVQAILKRKVQGVFNLSYYGYDLKFFLDDPRLSLANIKTFTYSTDISQALANDEDFTPANSTSVSYTPLLHSLLAHMTTNDTVAFYHAGDNTAFSRNYISEPDMTGVIHQIQVSMCVALNCSAYTNGSLNLKSVTLNLQSFLNNNQPLPGMGGTSIYPESAFTALTGTGLQLFFINAFIEPKLKVYANSPVTLNVKIDTTISGTNTYQLGILPVFSYITNNINKRWNHSMAVAHIHPLPEHGDELAKETDVKITGLMA